MLSLKAQKLKPTSTQTILKLMLDTNDLTTVSDISITKEEVQIPAHFQPNAKKIIQELLASNQYTLMQATKECFTWSSKVEPFRIKFRDKHPSVVTLDDKAQVYNEIITNIDAQGNIKYQVQSFDGTLHYIDINKINNGVVQQNHLTIVAPHLLAIEAEQQSHSSKEALRSPRRSI
jgi:hypothetical protein